jgi:hypothetical protein
MATTRTYHRAPKGGLSFNGKTYRAGQFIPAAALVVKPAPTIAEVVAPFGGSCNPWNDRIYVNFAAARRDHRGDQSKKMWFFASDPSRVVVERGKGTESNEFFYAFREAADALQTAGFAVAAR